MKHDESVIAFEDAKQEVLYLLQDRIALNATFREWGHIRECKKDFKWFKRAITNCNTRKNKNTRQARKNMKNLKADWS